MIKILLILGDNLYCIIEFIYKKYPQTQTFTFDALDRLTGASATGGQDGLYNEAYTYDLATGNLASKGGNTYTYADPAHAHAVTNLSNGNSYTYDANGNMVARVVGTDTYNQSYNADREAPWSEA